MIFKHSEDVKGSILEVSLFSSVSEKVDNQCSNAISTILKYDTDNSNQDDAFFKINKSSSPCKTK